MAGEGEKQGWVEENEAQCRPHSSICQPQRQLKMIHVDCPVLDPSDQAFTPPPQSLDVGALEQCVTFGEAALWAAAPKGLLAESLC